MKIVILYSGGIDSLIMYHFAKQNYSNANIECVYYDIGQPYAYKEIEAINDSGIDVSIRKVDWLNINDNTSGKFGSDSGNIFIPGRNLVLASLVASSDQPDQIWMGGLKGEDHEDSTDKNQTFIHLINKTFSYVYKGFKVPKLVFPFLDLGFGKYEAVEWAYTNGILSRDDLVKSSSCLSGTSGKCGVCVVCLRRWGIFSQLGFSEEYTTPNFLFHPNNKKIIIEMLETELGIKNGHYDKYRRREIIPALKMKFGNNLKAIHGIFVNDY